MTVEANVFFIIGSKWNNPLDLNKKSIVCSVCAIQIASMILEEKLLSNTDQLETLGNHRVNKKKRNTTNLLLYLFSKDKQNQKEQCRYGNKCKRQGNLSHIQKLDRKSVV